MEEKVYFMPGEVVTLKQDIPNKPVMIVVKKETMNIRKGVYSRVLCALLASYLRISG